MAHRDHKGKPSGVNKSRSETGIPTRMEPENGPNDAGKTEQYTEGDERIAENVRTNHPNRNTDKGDATGIGGYRQ